MPLYAAVSPTFATQEGSLDELVNSTFYAESMIKGTGTGVIKHATTLGRFEKVFVLMVDPNRAERRSTVSSLHMQPSPVASSYSYKRWTVRTTIDLSLSTRNFPTRAATMTQIWSLPSFSPRNYSFDSSFGHLCGANMNTSPSDV
ncbi:hypothetical protein GN244_ATG08599 [Phytophthora infestans]|uniref:Uncharacterized protein n=1 Tax=Phytophthora infestans TaxID=4787 RepID=A0A833WKB6_PHYIN|nr:hypothetical protein GN244_ATG08599 [Phytophthora infestans]